jgi:hypothetical protein
MPFHCLLKLPQVMPLLAFGKQAQEKHALTLPSRGIIFTEELWLKEPKNEEGKPKVDKNNPDETKRTTPLLGMKILSGFEFKGDNLWDDGTIYDAESGSTYNCKINLEDANTMNIRGFIGISAFGRTDIWKRLQMKK